MIELIVFSEKERERERERERELAFRRLLDPLRNERSLGCDDYAPPTVRRARGEGGGNVRKGRKWSKMEEKGRRQVRK